MKIQLAVVACALLLGAPARAVLALDPSQAVAGIDQRTLAEQWWQWGLGQPTSTSPLADATGAHAGVDNQRSVFFLGGTVGGTAARSFEVPAGKPLFFPILNAIDIELPNGGCDLHCAFGFISYVGSATGMYATLDGKDLLGGRSFRQTSTAFFTVDVPTDNPFGFPPPYFGKLDAVSDGYWVALGGLTQGQHTLKFGGTFADTGFAVGVTNTINAVPEPSTAALTLAGIGMLWATVRKRRFSQANARSRTPRSPPG